MKLTSLVVIFTVALSFLVFISEARACRCVSPPFEYRWKNSSVVFIGKVKDIETLYKYSWSAYDDKPVKVTFDVTEFLKDNGAFSEADEEEENNSQDRVAKGDIENKGKKALKKLKDTIRIGEEEKSSFTLHTSLQNLTCMGYPFKKGVEYLVYAYERRVDASEPWSLYNFPSETYGVGSLCGGTAEYRKAKEEIKRIRVQIDEDMILFMKKQKEQEK